jgi:hypothetical protein
VRYEAARSPLGRGGGCSLAAGRRSSRRPHRVRSRSLPPFNQLIATVAGVGAHAGRRDRARGGRRSAVRPRRETQRVCGPPASRPREWKQNPLRSAPDVDHYLKWACIEAATAICATRRRVPPRHVHRLYEPVARCKSHPKAIGAVARPASHRSDLLDPQQTGTGTVSGTEGRRRFGHGG